MQETPSTELCIVTETFAPEINGVANTLVELVKRLPPDQAILLVRPKRPEKNDSIRQNNLTVVDLPSAPIPGYPELRFGFPAYRKLLRLWSTHRPQKVYVATQGPLGWSAVSSARRLGIPTFSGFHTNFQSYCEFYGMGALKRAIVWYLRHFHRRTLKTLAPTGETAGQLTRMGIPNPVIWSRGVDADRFHPAKRCDQLRARWGVYPGQKVFLYVGRIAAEKNIALAIRAYYQAKTLHPEARMVLVGDGPEAGPLKQAHPDLIFTGTRIGEDLAKHYASADVFLFPSLTDTFGNVVLEAMASGLAVVSFDRAAAREHICHRHSGLLARPGDTPAFCQHACSLARNEYLHARLCKAARAQAVHLNWDGIVRRFQTILTNATREIRRHALYPNQRPLSQSR